jgi:hypothetical protein
LGQPDANNNNNNSNNSNHQSVTHTRAHTPFLQFTHLATAATYASVNALDEVEVPLLAVATSLRLDPLRASLRSSTSKQHNTTQSQELTQQSCEAPKRITL